MYAYILAKEPQPSTDSMMWVGNFLEDKRSVEKHISFQQKELQKKQPDMAVLEDSFHRTAVHRQKLCLQSTVAGILALQMKPVWMNIF